LTVTVAHGSLAIRKAASLAWRREEWLNPEIGSDCRPLTQRAMGIASSVGRAPTARGELPIHRLAAAFVECAPGSFVPRPERHCGGSDCKMAGAIRLAQTSPPPRIGPLKTFVHREIPEGNLKKGMPTIRTHSSSVWRKGRMDRGDEANTKQVTFVLRIG